MTSPAPAPTAARANGLARAVTFATVAFVWWRVSENTADNDLWGHVLYGQRMLHLGRLETIETLSWTAAGLPWINHEVLAEIILGGTHLLAGGGGLWWLMVGLAAVTLGLAWRLGAGETPVQRLTATAWLAILTNSIALGYAVRPQLFTYLFFVILLTLLRGMFRGRVAMGFFVPALLILWVNTHGGFLAGWLFVVVAVVTEIVLTRLPRLAARCRCTPCPAPGKLIGIAVLASVAVAANPWGVELVRWTVASLRLPRPEIFEWRSLSLSWANVPFFFSVGAGAAAWTCSRRPRQGWEMVVWLLLAFMTIRHQRHAPLFGLASLVFLPAHLLDACSRLGNSIASLRRGLALPGPRALLCLAATVAGGACLVASVAPSRAPLFRMAVPRNLYPVAALHFLREHALTGNTLTFFDWGQQVLWELPRNPVSFDGRLDTVYSPAIMEAHWQLYAGRAPRNGLDLTRADVALLPLASPAVPLLVSRGWRAVYRDPLAVILLRPAYPHRLPVTIAGAEAVSGSVAFPDAPARLATEP